MIASSLINIVLGVAGLLVVLTATAAIARANYAKAQLEGLRGDRDDLLARVQILETDNDIKQRRLAVLEDQNQMLQEMVTGKAEHDLILRELAAATQILTHHHAAVETHDRDHEHEAITRHREVMAKLGALQRQIGAR